MSWDYLLFCGNSSACSKEEEKEMVILLYFNGGKTLGFIKCDMQCWAFPVKTQEVSSVRCGWVPHLLPHLIFTHWSFEKVVQEQIETCPGMLVWDCPRIVTRLLKFLTNNIVHHGWKISLTWHFSKVTFFIISKEFCWGFQETGWL